MSEDAPDAPAPGLGDDPDRVDDATPDDAPGDPTAEPPGAADDPADDPAPDSPSDRGDTAAAPADEARGAPTPVDQHEPDAEDEDAAADDDDESDAQPAEESAAGPTAQPLRPMQTAAWWTMFGAFAVGTTAGVLAGLAERQEDRATRLSTLFDAETGAQPLYADRKDEYEQYLRRGEGFARAAIGVGVVSGVAALTAITLFAIDARRQRDERAPRDRATLHPRLGGLEVRF